MGRALGLAEHAMHLMAKTRGAANAARVYRVSGPLTPDILQKALELTQRRHPLLQMDITETRQGPVFRRLETPTIPLRRVVNTDENNWLPVLQEEINQGSWPEGHPLMRATLVQSSAHGLEPSSIILTFNHAIIDGRSVYRLFLEILTWCGKIAEGHALIGPPPYELLPPVEQLLPSGWQGLRGKAKTGALLMREMGQTLWHRPRGFAVETDAPPEKRRTGVLFRRLSTDETVAVLSRCRSERTSVHAGVGTATLLAARDIIKPGSAVSLGLASPVNLRPYLDPPLPEDYLGLSICGVRSMHRVGTDRDFWRFARQFKRDLDASIKRGDACAALFLQKMSTQLMLRIGMTPAVGMLTNPGVLAFPESCGPFRLEESYGALAYHGFGPAFFCSVATVQEALSFSFCYPEPLMSQETIEALAEGMLSHLRNACQ